MALILFEGFSAGLALMADALFMVVGWGVTYIALQIKHKRMVEDFRRELQAMEARMNSAIASFQSQHQVIETTTASAAPRALHSAPAGASASPAAVSPPAEEITAETLLVIAAAVTVFLGKKVRVRSAQMLQTPYEIINQWSQQGRVIVQASHNLSPRGHRE
jgi:hypothetical protein